MLYLPYIQLSPDPIDRNITTKELVKLKFFHLMNFMALQNNQDYLAEIIALEGLLSQISGGNLKLDFTDSDAGKK